MVSRIKPPAESIVGGAQKTLVPQEREYEDQVTGGAYKQSFPYKIVPVPDPTCATMAQWLAETPHRMHTLERVLRADCGDPKLQAYDMPPYVRCHPKGISLAAYPQVAEIVMDNRNGLVIVGNTAFRNPAEQISWGGICNFNSQLMNVVPSSVSTPITTFLFAVKQSVVARAAAKAPPGSPTHQALESPAAGPEAMAAPGAPAAYKVTMDTGKNVTVSGAESAEAARAQATQAARAAGSGRSAVAIEKLAAPAATSAPSAAVMPAPGRISSPFGMRTNPVTGQYKMHNGVDIASPMGTPVGAAQEGVVIKSDYSGSYGNRVVIQHPDGSQSLYAHLQRSGAAEGTKVAAGQEIGQVGSTGRSTGAHLHFETRLPGGGATDPVAYVRKIQKGAQG